MANMYDFWGDLRGLLFEAWYNPERGLVYAKISVADDGGKKYVSAAKASLEAIRAQRWTLDCRPELDLRIAMLSHAKLTVGPDVMVRIKECGDVRGGEAMTATLLFIFEEGWAELKLENFEHVLPGGEPPESDSLVMPPIKDTMVIETVDVEE